MKKFSFVLIAFLALCDPACPSDFPLELTIKSAESIYEIDDEITMRLVVRNTSGKALEIICAKDIDLDFLLLFRDSVGKECPRTAFQTMEPARHTVVLRPGEILTHKITGRITKESGYIGGKRNLESVHGLFVRFPDIFDVYLSGGCGRYFIQGIFYGYISDRNRIPLLSNRIEVQIVETN